MSGGSVLFQHVKVYYEAVDKLSMFFLDRQEYEAVEKFKLVLSGSDDYVMQTLGFDCPCK